MASTGDAYLTSVGKLMDSRPLLTDFGFSFLAESSVIVNREPHHGGTLYLNGWLQSNMWAPGMTTHA